MEDERTTLTEDEIATSTLDASDRARVMDSDEGDADTDDSDSDADDADSDADDPS